MCGKECVITTQICGVKSVDCGVQYVISRCVRGFAVPSGPQPKF